MFGAVVFCLVFRWPYSAVNVTIPLELAVGKIQRQIITLWKKEVFIFIKKKKKVSVRKLPAISMDVPWRHTQLYSPVVRVQSQLFFFRMMVLSPLYTPSQNLVKLYWLY